MRERVCEREREKERERERERLHANDYTENRSVTYSKQRHYVFNLIKSPTVYTCYMYMYFYLCR